jgi:hypothetical protein
MSVFRWFRHVIVTEPDSPPTHGSPRGREARCHRDCRTGNALFPRALGSRSPEPKRGLLIGQATSVEGREHDKVASINESDSDADPCIPQLHGWRHRRAPRMAVTRADFDLGSVARALTAPALDKERPLHRETSTSSAPVSPPSPSPAFPLSVYPTQKPQRTDPCPPHPPTPNATTPAPTKPGPSTTNTSPRSTEPNQGLLISNRALVLGEKGRLRQVSSSSPFRVKVGHVRIQPDRLGPSAATSCRKRVTSLA